MSRREQQTARGNVDDELARLVRNDLRRNPSIEPPKPSTDEPSATEAPDAIDSEPARRETSSVQRDRPRQRLADLDLLTELP